MIYYTKKLELFVDLEANEFEIELSMGLEDLYDKFEDHNDWWFRVFNVYVSWYIGR